MQTLLQSHPKIGIRPTIDGRMGGVRESLEQRTMDQAKAVAELYSSVLRYPDGSPVECVIADTCIGGVAEAAACAEKFRREGVGLSLTVTPCWCYGSETMDMDPHLPKAVWGFNGTERPGAVYLAAVLAGHTQKGLPAFGIYGKDVQSASDTAIPDDVRGRMAVLELISYAIGPSVGDLRSTAVARLTSLPASFVIGGLACSGSCLTAGPALRELWNFESTVEATP